MKKGCFAMCWMVGLIGCDKPERNEEPRTRANLPERGQVQGRNQVFEAALQAALAQESPNARDQALSAFVLESHEAAPGLAAEALSHLPEGSAMRAKTLESLAELMAQKGVDRALQWAESLPTVQDVALARQAVGLALAEIDPSVGAQVVLEHHDRRRALDETELHVLQLWAGSSAPDAAAWAQQLAQRDARHAALQSVCGPWIQTDAVGVFAWLDGISNTKSKTEALDAVADALAEAPDAIRDAFLTQAGAGIREELEERLGVTIETPADESDDKPVNEPIDESLDQNAAGADGP
jgi:hypothetical protein